MTDNHDALRLADALETAPAHVLQDNTVTLELGTSTATKAAAELRRLADIERRFYELQRHGVSRAAYQKAETQRDLLLEALKSTGLFLHHCWCDVQMNDYSFEKLNHQMAVVDAAIKAVEE